MTADGSGRGVPHLELWLDAVVGNVALVRHTLLAFAADGGADGPLLGRVALAVTEACANAAVHAYRDRAEPGPMLIQADIEEGDLEVLVVDEGCGLVPRHDSPGLGLGLAVIAESADAFAIREHEPGLEVWMSFALGREAPVA